MPPRKGLSTKAIVTSGIILIMVMSSLGFILQNAGGGAQRFGKYKFSPSGSGTWTVKAQGQQFEVFFLPTQLADMGREEGMTQNLRAPVLVASIDPPPLNLTRLDNAIGLVSYQYVNELPKLGTEVGLALGAAPGEDAPPGPRAMPVISCGNATPEVPVIYVRKGDSTGFHLEGDCIVMEAASEQDIYRLYDRMLLSLIGVMP